MVLSPYTLLTPHYDCPTLVGWRAQFSHAISPLEVVPVGSTEIPIAPQSGRSPFAAGEVLHFEDYGYPFSRVTLDAPLSPTDEVIKVKPLTLPLYPTARAAAGPYSLAGAVLSGAVLRGSASVASFVPVFVGASIDGLIEAAYDLGSLPSFVQRCDDPPYRIQVRVAMNEGTTLLFMGQTQADAHLGHRDVLVQYQMLDAGNLAGGLSRWIPLVF